MPRGWSPSPANRSPRPPANSSRWSESVVPRPCRPARSGVSLVCPSFCPHVVLSMPSRNGRIFPPRHPRQRVNPAPSTCSRSSLRLSLRSLRLCVSALNSIPVWLRLCRVREESPCSSPTSFSFPLCPHCRLFHRHCHPHAGGTHLLRAVGGPFHHHRVNRLTLTQLL